MSEPATSDLLAPTRRSLEALSRRDYDGALAAFSAHAVLDVTAGDMETFRGREAIREFFELWRGPYEDFELELEEFQDYGNGVALSVVAQRGRLPGSSAFLSLVGGYVGVWRDGLVERYTVYRDLAQARADAERLAQERG